MLQMILLFPAACTQRIRRYGGLWLHRWVKIRVEKLIFDECASAKFYPLLLRSDHWSQNWYLCAILYAIKALCRCVPLLQINHDLHLQKVSCLAKCYRTNSLKGFCFMHIYSWGVLFSRIFSAHFSSLPLPVSSPFPSLTIFSFNSGCGDCGHAAGFTGRLGDAVFKFVFFCNCSLFTARRFLARYYIS